MNRERKTEIKIYSWLRPYVSEIYFNSKNELSAPIFKVKCSSKKRIPDLIIKTKINEYISVEVKPTSQNNEKVMEGKSQLFEDQYINYIEGNLSIFIEDEEIKIKSFLLATDDSLNGSIFKIKEYDILRDNLNGSEHKRQCVLKYKSMPRYEYLRTHDLMREIFKTHKQYVKRNNKKIKKEAGIGILINDKIKNTPHCYVKYKLKNWQQHYWEL